MEKARAFFLSKTMRFLSKIMRKLKYIFVTICPHHCNER